MRKRDADAPHAHRASKLILGGAMLLPLLTTAFIAGCGLETPQPFTRELADCAGSFAGTFSGDDQGNFSATMSASGSVEGTLVSALVGTGALIGTMSADGRFVGAAFSGGIFRGNLSNECSMTGTWENGNASGRWSAVRLSE